MPTPWIESIKPNPDAKMRLFCFPPAGGHASFFRDWPKKIPSSIEICPIQYPGRGNRFTEAPYLHWEDLRRDITIALKDFLDKPFAAFGYSMGSVIAFETLRSLRKTYKVLPERLGVAACMAPQRHHEFETLPYLASDEEFLARIRRMGGMPPEVSEHKDLLQLLLPILRSDAEMTATYAYHEDTALPCPIFAFAGEDDPEVPPSAMEAWETHTTETFSFQVFPGQHFFIQQNLETVLQTFLKGLEK